MAISPHFFNKRDNETPAGRHVVPLPQVAGLNASVGAMAIQEPGRAQTNVTTSGSTHVSNSAANQGAEAAGAPPVAVGSKLTVGPNIKLKGVEITDCDTLFVEGLVEATMDARLMEIAEPGAFKGSAEIDLAEIRGQFDGDLTVREKLVIYATGRVTGKIRYGKLVIEEGGQISGDIQFGASHSAKPAGTSKQMLAVAG
ncbi:MAG: cell shape determination protein CcmA [Rhodoferax ferrireducens]|uniref:Cell shape determination protein CcmA n=2 Tax=Pseudomonadota TaxID=1224 RepID=A0A1Y1QZ68_9GAMM|nr:MAG: cell shape determination protein CcmA [Rhodoferax ferrireducens]OQX17177.1 MAG: cell shape determination protein CcmA [Thiothrix lacustris]